MITVPGYRVSIDPLIVKEVRWFRGKRFNPYISKPSLIDILLFKLFKKKLPKPSRPTLDDDTNFFFHPDIRLFDQNDDVYVRISCESNYQAEKLADDVQDLLDNYWKDKNSYKFLIKKNF